MASSHATHYTIPYMSQGITEEDYNEYHKFMLSFVENVSSMEDLTGKKFLPPRPTETCVLTRHSTSDKKFKLKWGHFLKQHYLIHTTYGNYLKYIFFWYNDYQLEIQISNKSITNEGGITPNFEFQYVNHIINNNNINNNNNNINNNNYKNSFNNMQFLNNALKYNIPIFLSVYLHIPADENSGHQILLLIFNKTIYFLETYDISSYIYDFYPELKIEPSDLPTVQRLQFKLELEKIFNSSFNSSLLTYFNSTYNITFTRIERPILLFYKPNIQEYDVKTSKEGLCVFWSLLFAKRISIMDLPNMMSTIDTALISLYTDILDTLEKGGIYKLLGEIYTTYGGMYKKKYTRKIKGKYIIKSKKELLKRKTERKKHYKK